MLSAKSAKHALLLSLLSLVCFAGAEDARDVLSIVEKATVSREALRAIQSKLNDAELRNGIERYLEAPNNENLEALTTMARLRALALRDGPNGNAGEEAKAITNSPLYRKLDERKSSNWMTRGFEKLGDWLSKRTRTDTTPARRTQGSAGDALGWVTPLMWILLGGAVVAGLYWLLARVSFANFRRAKKMGILDEGEPERTADEWLLRSLELEAAHQFRNAVRALYIACLVRFDDYGVVRFVRSETNWEHLSRLKKSGACPSHLDFESPTKKFDLIWYGDKEVTSEDVAEFRSFYEQLLAALRGRRAA